MLLYAEFASTSFNTAQSMMELEEVLEPVNLSANDRKTNRSPRYNSFGHHSEDGLVLYNRISMAAHGCDPTCCWTYGDEESFVLRARVTLQPGAELTISYLQDEDLLKSTNVRRRKLENWKFMYISFRSFCEWR